MVVMAVLSDIHAYDGNPDNIPSEICISKIENSPSRHPFRGLEKLILKQGLKADAILCAGDLCDQASPAATEYVWKEIHRMGELLGTTDILATVGNHDMDSRGTTTSYSPKETLQRLRPRFPGLDPASCDKFWASEFAVLEKDRWRILVLNSAAYHGYGSSTNAEHRHGRISEHTIELIREELSTLNVDKLNILLTHHHLIRHNPLGESDYSEMQGADQLLDMLDGGQFGEWLIIHGHKHFPRIFYAQGGMTSPIIFAAGSFSANLYARLARVAQNQFYLLELDTDETDRLRLGVAGLVRAWNWVPLRGWQPANVASGIPRSAGFGYRGSRRDLVARIKQMLVTEDVPFLTWDEVVAREKQLRYLLPSDQEKLKVAIEADPELVVQGDHGVAIAQVSRTRA